MKKSSAARDCYAREEDIEQVVISRHDRRAAGRRRARREDADVFPHRPILRFDGGRRDLASCDKHCRIFIMVASPRFSRNGGISPPMICLPDSGATFISTSGNGTR